MQVLIIHGAGGFINEDRSDFVAALRKKQPKLADFRRQGDWKSNLQKVLGDEYDVLQPRMPDSDHPYYDAWMAWFEQIIPLLDDEVVLIGHSLGALFLAKYLSENSFPKKIKALILAAAPYTGPEVQKDLMDRLEKGHWLLGSDISKIEQARNICIVHSTDDPAVPYTAAEAYKSKLPKAVLITLEGRGHLRGESLPEVEDFIRGLSA